jgi:hypothetical protein
MADNSRTVVVPSLWEEMRAGTVTKVPVITHRSPKIFNSISELGKIDCAFCRK